MNKLCICKTCKNTSTWFDRHLRGLSLVSVELMNKNYRENIFSLPQTKLCKYQLAASYLLYFSKASPALLTFIYICCQRITFESYEKLSGPACLNVVTHKFIIRALGTRLKGLICDPNANKRWATATNIKKTSLQSAERSLPNRLTRAHLLLFILLRISSPTSKKNNLHKFMQYPIYFGIK